MGGFFGGGSTTTKTELDPTARQLLENIVSQTQGLQSQNPPFVQPFDPAQVAGLQQLQDRPQSTFIPTAEQNLNATLGGDFFGANPALGNFNQGLAGVTDAITDAATRGVGDQFSLAGRTGSPAQSISLAKTIANQLAPFQFGAFQNNQNQQFQGFENERQRQLAGLSLAPTVESIQDAQARRLLGVGDVIQGQNQATLTEPLQSFEFFLNPLLSAAGGFPTSSNVRDRASGSQVVSSIGGILGQAAELGKVFSDIRMKENITFVGSTHGINFYTFNYVFDDQTRIGPMAQEVEKLHPEVVSYIDGFRVIDMERLGGLTWAAF